MNDTHPLIQQKMDEMIRTMAPEQRLMQCFRFYNDGLKFAEAGVLLDNPDLCEKELKAEVFRRMYMNELSEVTIQAVIDRFMKYDSNQGV